MAGNDLVPLGSNLVLTKDDPIEALEAMLAALQERVGEVKAALAAARARRKTETGTPVSPPHVKHVRTNPLAPLADAELRALLSKPPAHGRLPCATPNVQAWRSASAHHRSGTRTALRLGGSC